jgi:hypothetical protein
LSGAGLRTARPGGPTWQDEAVSSDRPGDVEVTEPILLPTRGVRVWTAAAAVLAPAMVGLGWVAGPVPGVSVVVLLVAVLAWGWPPLLGLPGSRGSGAVLVVGGAASLAAVTLTRSEPRLRWLALAVAGALLGAFVHQLARRDGRPRLVDSVSGEVAGVVLLASLSTVGALPDSPVGPDGVLVWAAAVAAALVTQVRSTSPVMVPVGVLAGAAGGAVAGAVAGAASGALAAGTSAGVGPVPGLVAGAFVAGVAVMVQRLLTPLPAAVRGPGWLAVAVAPVAASGLVGYVALRLMVG